MNYSFKKEQVYFSSEGSANYNHLSNAVLEELKENIIKVEKHVSDFNTQNHEVEVKFHALVQINNSNVCKSECDENTNSTSNSNNNRSLISLNCSSLFNSNSNSNQFLKENEELQKKMNELSKENEQLRKDKDNITKKRDALNEYISKKSGDKRKLERELQFLKRKLTSIEEIMVEEVNKTKPPLTDANNNEADNTNAGLNSIKRKIFDVLRSSNDSENTSYPDSKRSRMNITEPSKLTLNRLDSNL